MHRQSEARAGRCCHAGACHWHGVRHCAAHRWEGPQHFGGSLPVAAAACNPWPACARPASSGSACCRPIRRPTAPVQPRCFLLCLIINCGVQWRTRALCCDFMPRSICPPITLAKHPLHRAVEDESFWQGLEPVHFGGLPRLQDSVTVIGCARCAALLRCCCRMLPLRHAAAAAPGCCCCCCAMRCSAVPCRAASGAGSGAAGLVSGAGRRRACCKQGQSAGIGGSTLRLPTTLRCVRLPCSYPIGGDTMSVTSGGFWVWSAMGCTQHAGCRQHAAAPPHGGGASRRGRLLHAPTCQASPPCRMPFPLYLTTGVVSRIEVTGYAHGAAELLGIQVRWPAGCEVASRACKQLHLGPPPAPRCPQPLASCGPPPHDAPTCSHSVAVALHGQNGGKGKTAFPKPPMQVDAAINSGNSGGPAFNDRGEPRAGSPQNQLQRSLEPLRGAACPLEGSPRPPLRPPAAAPHPTPIQSCHLHTSATPPHPPPARRVRGHCVPVAEKRGHREHQLHHPNARDRARERKTGSECCCCRPGVHVLLLAAPRACARSSLPILRSLRSPGSSST